MSSVPPRISEGLKTNDWYRYAETHIGGDSDMELLKAHLRPRNELFDTLLSFAIGQKSIIACFFIENITWKISSDLEREWNVFLEKSSQNIGIYLEGYDL